MEPTTSEEEGGMGGGVTGVLAINASERLSQQVGLGERQAGQDGYGRERRRRYPTLRHKKPRKEEKITFIDMIPFESNWKALPAIGDPGIVFILITEKICTIYYIYLSYTLKNY